MLDLRADSIIYQSQAYLVTLLDSLVTNKRLGKALNKKWDKADHILALLEAWQHRDKIADITQANYILECLILLCNLNQFPTAPTILVTDIPAILVGQPGQSIVGPRGLQGLTGMATDFLQTLVTVPTVIDSFDVTDAKAARWDYVVIQDTGQQRAGYVIGTWLEDGSLIEMFDSSTEDINGTTEPLTFDIEFLAGNIRLIAIPSSGTWTVIGTRYFIPNNGNGTGPISDSLPNGQIYVGNATNLAQARTVSGVIAIDNTGVTSLNIEVVDNSHIATAAGIEVTKLASLTPSQVVITDSSGFLTTSAVTTTQLNYLSTVTSNVQTQLNTKLTDPTTTIGDLIIRNGSNLISRLGVGTAGQILTVTGGLPTWQNPSTGITGLTVNYIPRASSATTITDSLISQVATSGILVSGNLEASTGWRTAASGPFFLIKEVPLGDWNMDTTATLEVAHGVDYTKIREVFITIRTDSDVGGIPHRPLNAFNASTGVVQGGTLEWNSTNIRMNRLTGGDYDSVSYNATSYNRGWALIIYQP